MIDISNTQFAVRFLQEWLTANEFRQVLSQHGLVTSDDYAEWVNPTLRIEITFDRGECYLSLGLREMANTYHPDEWEAWLERLPLRRHLSDLEHQVDFITRRWMAAAHRAADDVAKAEAALEAIGLDWVQKRFGWRPGDESPDTLYGFQGPAGPGTRNSRI
jgi:hypothetical protein